MIDELSDPLLHLVRNALDHGIEPPEVRAAAGKPPEGFLNIKAFHRGNSIFIQISDDGAGLDLGRVVAKSVEKGILSQSEADGLTPQQAQSLIWRPGVSTAGQVTEVSGRGVGMSIIRSRIESLHGAIELDSVSGHGTTFTIRLPLTLAILPCLMIVVEGETFALPMEVVKEIVALDANQFASAHQQPTVHVRNRLLATLRLDELLAGCDRRPLGRRLEGKTTLVVVGEGNHDVALAVDRVLGQDDVVIKSLAENYRHVPGVAGATILGDGRVALILDVPALLNRSLQRSVRQFKP